MPVRAGIAALANSNGLSCIEDNACCYLQIYEQRKNAESKRDAPMRVLFIVELAASG